jgi:hypothetical protein
MKSTSKHLCTLLVSGILSLTPFAAIAAPFVTSGFDPGATDYGAVRWRNFANFPGDNEIRIGTIPLTPGGDFATADYFWPGILSTHVKFVYDGAGTITTEVGNLPVAASYNLASLPASPVNYLRIDLCNSNQSAVKLNNVVLDGAVLGSFGFPSGCQSWSVVDIDESAGFILEGDIQFVNYQSGFDQSLIQLRFGNYAPSAAGAPVVSNVAVSPAPVLLNGPATVSATIDDTSYGNNPITAAEYSLNGGPWVAMTAQDGAFDAISEDVEAGFTAVQIGSNEVCVRGIDSLDNTSSPQCQTYTVTYQFEGFFTPIDSQLMNVAKAGQTVPAKWRLTDFNGTPIDNPASFAGMWSYPISCTDATALATDAVEEYAAGNSVLHYNGDGNWQFNWKVPKNYKNQCYAMYVLFDSGLASPVTTFKFTK